MSDSKYAGLREPFRAITFVPIAQHPSLRSWPEMVIRSSGPAALVTPAIKRAVAELRPDMTMQLRLFETEVRDGLVRERLLAWLAGAFGVLAAALAVFGVYGVVAYLVARRRHEMAIRLALGASRARLVVLVLREMAGWLAAGLLVGGALAATAARGASGLLFGLSPSDPGTMAAAAGALAAVAAMASIVPAFRAARANAMAALGSE